MNIFSFSSPAKRTNNANNANNATDYVKLGKKRRESFKRNYYIISARMIVKAILILHIVCFNKNQNQFCSGVVKI